MAEPITPIVYTQLIPDSFQFGLVATGAAQGNAAPLIANRNVVVTVPASTGVILPTPIAPMEVLVINAAALTLSVYPPVGWSINNGTVNAAVTIATTAALTFISGDPSESTWWSCL